MLPTLLDHQSVQWCSSLQIDYQRKTNKQTMIWLSKSPADLSVSALFMLNLIFGCAQLALKQIRSFSTVQKHFYCSS